MTHVLHDIQQVKIYKQAAQRLLGALALHSKAKADYDRTRDVYEDARRELITRGVGTQSRASTEEKEAALSNALRGELLELRAARDTLRSAEAELEAARIVERAERETLRSRQRDYEFEKSVAS